MSKTQTPEAVAVTILRLVREDERDLKWLSRKSLIPYSTLRDNLTTHPERLTIRKVGLIAEALGRPIVEVMA